MSARRAWIVVVVAGLVGLILGAVGGYVGYFLQLTEPLMTAASRDPNAPPFKQTYDDMARLKGFDVLAASCDGSKDLIEIIENEVKLIDAVELNASRAGLAPPLNVARAIAVYRLAALAEARSDKQAFDAAVEREKKFLEAAGWKDTSHDLLARVVRNMDGCSAHTAAPEEKK